MSYSRWGSSFWYSYWQSTDSVNKKDQNFVADDSVFTYAEIEEDINKCLDSAIEHNVDNSVCEIERKDLRDELMKYMANFILDVNLDKDFV